MPDQEAQAPALPQKLTRIVLIGFMGAGKSTVGPLVAAQLGWRFIDVDDVISSREGRTVAQIFADEGEAHFRRLEQETVAQLMSEEMAVIALGGGAIETAQIRSMIAGAHGTLIAFLHVSLPTVLSRCGQSSIVRPVLADRERLSARYESRMAWYREAHMTIDTNDVPAELVAQRLFQSVAPLVSENAPKGNTREKS